MGYYQLQPKSECFVLQLKAGAAGLDYNAMTERARDMTTDATGTPVKQEGKQAQEQAGGPSQGATGAALSRTCHSYLIASET